MKYRAEIDGLRAIAVLSVIFFHFGFYGFQGGFVGVDIFFVISGYLITSLILSELEQGKFSLVNFYERRARRILPALLVVLSFIYLFSWIFILPFDHKTIGQYVVTTLFFASNLFLLFQKNNYFKLEEDNNPLLHTWSLAVEEQYYILFPLLLMILWKSRRNLLLIIVIFGLVSLGLAQWLVHKNALATFYLLPTRAWELLAGALCAIYLKQFTIKENIVSQISGLLGLALIFYAILFFNQKTPTPSIYTLVPVLGATLVIVFSQANSLVNKILSYKIVVGIGLISYSAYLWHQPLLVYSRELAPSMDSIKRVFILLPITLGLAYLTWFSVEQYFRNRKKLSTKGLIGFLVPASLVLLVFGFLGHLNNGFENRNETFKRLAYYNTGFGMQCNGNYQYNHLCASSAIPAVVTLGNSYMMHFIQSLVDQYAKDDVGVLQLTQEGCEISLVKKEADKEENDCVDFFENALKTIQQSVSTQVVIISSPFNGVLDTAYNHSLLDIIQKITQQNKRVVLLGPTPNAPFHVGRCIARKHSLAFILAKDDSCDFSVSDKHWKKVQALKELTAGKPLVQFIDITQIVCPDNYCRMELDTGLFMYVDEGHLSNEGARYVLEHIQGQLPKPYGSNTIRSVKKLKSSVSG